MSLQEKIEKQKAEFKEQAPDEALQVMERATRDLIDSGQAGEAAGEGDRLPDFALPDTNGETVRSSELLSRGPLVVSFYRGVW